MEPSDSMDETQNETAEAEDVEEAEALESEAFLDREIPAEEFDVPLSIQPGDQTDASQDTALAPYDPLQRYLAEVRKYPFLSKEEEMQLFHEYRTTGNREAAVKFDRKSTRLNSSHGYISYAVFCLKKKKTTIAQ